MTCCWKTALGTLGNLAAETLHETSKKLRSDLGNAEWELGLCLLASVKHRRFRELGYATISEYAERALQLSGKKAGSLLGAARALEHLPILSEAFKDGKLGWGKLRAIQTLATPETEEQWLAFALHHTTDQVVRKVALSPQEWKRQQALQASLASRPIVDSDSVAIHLFSSQVEATCTSIACPDSSESVTEPAVPGPKRADLSSGPQAPLDNSNKGRGDEFREAVTEAPGPTPGPRPHAPLMPKTIRVIVHLTPDQYALFEMAERRVRNQERKRVGRAVIVTKMAEALLNQGTARSRAKHQVLIHTTEDGSSWYDTQHGPLPVASDVLFEANKSGPEPVILGRRQENNIQPSGQVDNRGHQTKGLDNRLDADGKQHQRSATASDNGDALQETKGGGRPPIPNAMIRALFARAGHRCERCDARSARLEAHHRKPVSEGGLTSLATLELLCPACHRLKHEPDFASKPKWRMARDQARLRSKVGRPLVEDPERITAEADGRDTFPPGEFEAARMETEERRVARN